jgi:hypothetical protein
MTTFTALPDPLRRLVEMRVEELLRYRAFYRAHRSIDLTLIEDMHRVELRSLVRLLRAARAKQEADTVWMFGPPVDTTGGPFPEQADPVTAAKAYHDWQAGR